jgi:UDPglucose 6-dehydrogenase
MASNEQHKSWVLDRVQQLIASIEQPVVSILGLTYKPGTSTLRRSAAVELCVQLHGQGMRVRAHDPVVDILPEELRSAIRLCPSPPEALNGADLAVVATEWPEYRALRTEHILERMRRPQIIDQNRFLADILADDARITYVATGKAQRAVSTQYGVPSTRY